jgi:hypothetical protein
MSAVFARSGVRFQFPENWAVETEDAAGTDPGGDGDAAPDGEGGWTVIVQSPATAFVVVSLRPHADGPAAATDEALAALMSEYPDAEAEAVIGQLAGLPATGHDVEFITLDTTTTCRTRAADTPRGTLLVLWQVTDYDRVASEPVLDAIVSSLTVEGD